MEKFTVNVHVSTLLCLMLTLPGAYAEEPRFLDMTPFEPTLSSAGPTPELSTSSGTFLILFHQQVLSEADGPRSHFYPTSSEYMKRALQRYGIRGYLLGMDRLLRENDDDGIYPCTTIGCSYRKYDPVP